ncbi:DUF502 domain-containing protein [Thermincola potens]|uniref:DUF502 domain-containing protein n=2 Tax=Thermincola TaxID=278993 RepID=D5XFB7_THEPJ|nr:DUF502 domain-containing protein [Thermincola potens]ADG82338.1 protein of unknown function DUF502 [Thermincola potens JR]
MKTLTKYFLNGILVLSPIMLTILIISKVLVAWDTTAGKFFPLKVPGLPLLMSIVVIVLIGYMASWWLSGQVLGYIDRLFTKVPVVQFIYGIIKDTVTSLLGEKKSFGKVAVITIPGTEMKVIGFVTSEDLEHIGFKDYVAVYVMQSMQWAGNTVLVPKKNLEILEGVKIEDVMKFIVSAGAVSSVKNNQLIES